MTEWQQEARDPVAKLSDRLLSLGTKWEEELKPRLDAKSDDFVAAFSAQLNGKAVEAATQVANTLRLQTEAASKASTTERSKKAAQLLEAASRYENGSRSELVELCFLSAFKCSDGNPGFVLKQFLAWKERDFAAMSESNMLKASPAKLMSLYETLDKVLPDSTVSPDEMEQALSTADRIREGITKRQEAKIAEISNILSWATFDAKNRSAYAKLKESLVSLSPVNQELEKEKSKVQELAENFIQTASAISSASLADLVPPSPKAPAEELTKWFKHGLALVAVPTNTIETRIAGLSVLMDFAHNQGELPECKRYAEVLTNESVKLACAQWAERVDKYGEMTDKKDKADADTLAVGQSLLNQGFAILKSITNRATTADVTRALPGLASKLNLQREMLLVGQMRLTDAPDAFSSKEQAARARSLLYGQVLSALFDARAVESQIIKECNPASKELVSLKAIQKRLGEYLTAYDKFDRADRSDEQANQIAELRQKYQRYANHCQGQIYEGWLDFKAAEKVADEWLARWGNEKAQGKLKEGLRALYSIDVNELNRADPGVAAEWSRIEELLKKNYDGKPSTVNAETPKKSLNEF
jgi:hypothetical protein